jgi:hypothetical protein
LNYLTFTDLGGSFGYQDLTVTPADFSGSATLSNCLFRYEGNASITADDKTIVFGSPTPTFTFTPKGFKSPDTVGSVTYTFTGVGGITYGPSTVPPTAAGSYTITPSAAVMTTGDLANYDNLQYINGTYTITGFGHPCRLLLIARSMATRPERVHS